jgi:hypothetical protein
MEKVTRQIRILILKVCHEYFFRIATTLCALCEILHSVQYMPLRHFVVKRKNCVLCENPLCPLW